MPISNVPVYFTREDSTYGAGSKLESNNASLTNGTVTLSLPGTSLGSPCYSAPMPTRSGAVMPSTVYVTSSYDVYEVPPNGTGWFLEDGGLDGNRPWYDTVATSATINFASWSGIFDAYAYLRFWSYRPSTGEYTWLGMIYDQTTTFRNNNDAVPSATTFNTAFANAVLASDCILYVDLIWYYNDGGCTARTVNMVTGDGTSQISLRIRPQSEAGPSHDNLANAYPIGTGYTGFAQPANGVWCSYEPGETRNVVYDSGWALNLDGPGSVWFKWTCPTDGSQPEVFKVELGPQRDGIFYDGQTQSPYYGQDASMATRMRVYTSSSPSAPTYASLTLIADVTKSGGENWQASPDWWSEYQINSPVPGQTYFFQCMSQNQLSTSSGTGELIMQNVGYYYGLCVTNIRMNWRQLWRGPWISRPEVTYDRSDLPTLNLYSSWSDMADGNTGWRFQGSDQFHGGWSFWQQGGRPDPCKSPEAHEIASFICHNGDQSTDENSNHYDAYWELNAQFPYSPYWVPGAYRVGGRINPFDVGAQPQTAGGLPDGQGGGNGVCSTGGSVSSSPQGVMVGGMLETRSVWSAEVFSPMAAAYNHNIWTYLGKLPGSTDTSGLPAGTYGVAYSKENCDVVSFKVRPNSGGYATHPNNGLFGQTIRGDWYWQKNEYPLRPPRIVSGDAVGWGMWFRNYGASYTGPKVLATHTRCVPSSFPEVLPGDLQNQYGTVFVGSVTYSGGVQTGRDMGWTQVLSYQEYDRDIDPSPDYDSYFLFPFIADYIQDNLTIGNQIATAQAGTSSWSFARRIDDASLEFELILQPPCYAFMYDSPQYPTNTCPGMTLPPPDLIDPPLRQKQRDDDNGLITDGSMTPRVAGTGASSRPTSEQREATPRIQTRNFKGYR